MPYYTFRCTGCGESACVASAIKDRDQRRQCDGCGEALRRQLESTITPLKLHHGSAEPAPRRDEPESPTSRVPNATLRDCHIENCGTGVAMEGGHAVVDGMSFVNTPVAFDLSDGATVDVKRVDHQAGSSESNTGAAIRCGPGSSGDVA